MKFFRLDLLTLLISLFLLGSCKNENTLGLAVDPNQQISGTLTDTATLKTNTVLEDTVATSALANTPLAYFKDPVIGTTEANIATGVSSPTTYSVPHGTVTIDSVMLVLRYGAGFYGDSLTSRYKVNVYQLNERPLPNATYYNNKSWDYNSSYLLGSKTFNARPNTKFQITDIVAGAKDTLKTVPSQVRIKVDPAFIQNNVFNQDSATVISASLFQNKIKGIYLTLDKNQVGNGGRIYFAVDSSSIDVYYRNTTSSAVDTTVISLPLANHAAQIKHTYSTAVTAALNNTASQETIYLEGLGGTRTKIAFPYLKNLLTTAGSDVVINRAELVITPLPGSDIPYVPQPKLTMYTLNLAKQRSLIQDANLATSTTAGDPRAFDATTFGGYYDATTRQYHFVLTGFISDLMRGKTVDYGTYIAPDQYVSGATAVNIAATPQAYGRSIVGGAVSNTTSANYPYRMRLNIIYTKSTK